MIRLDVVKLVEDFPIREKKWRMEVAIILLIINGEPQSQGMEGVAGSPDQVGVQLLCVSLSRTLQPFLVA